MALSNKEQREMYNAVIRIDTSLENLQKSAEDHEKRLRFLEKHYWIFFGIGIVITFILGNISLDCLAVYLPKF